jgi:1-acyl-sn-glycerol-3-phosphate acyltransferase
MESARTFRYRGRMPPEARPGPSPQHSDSLLTFAMERPLHYVWGLFADAGIFVSTIVLGTIATLGAVVTRRGWPVDVLGKLWCRLIVSMCGIDVELEGAHHLRPGQSYVLISNHLSNFDIWCTLAVLRVPVHFVAKKELLRFPFFGQALAVSDHIVIDRQNPESAIEKINAAAAGSKRGVCILFYAEGTRSSDGDVHAFKKGGVTLALRSRLPIVPVSVSGTRKFLPKGCAVIRPGGKVKLVLGEPISTEGLDLEARDELNERVREAVLRNFVLDY